MDLPKIVMEDDLLPPAEPMDEEDRELVIYECYGLLGRILSRTNPNWLQSEGSRLLERIERSMSWHRLH